MGGERAAQAGECADEQGDFWDYHNELFVDPGAYASIDDFVELAEGLDLDGEQFRECLESSKYDDEILNDYNDGRNYGVSGTPTFFINGIRLVGAQPLSAFKAIIDKELEK